MSIWCESDGVEPAASVFKAFSFKNIGQENKIRKNLVARPDFHY